MSMPDQADSSSFTNSWVITGKNAKLSTKAVASDLNFKLQCKHCEKDREIGGLNEQLEEDYRCLEYLQIQLLEERSKGADVERQNKCCHTK